MNILKKTIRFFLIAISLVVVSNFTAPSKVAHAAICNSQAECAQMLKDNQRAVGTQSIQVNSVQSAVNSLNSNNINATASTITISGSWTPSGSVTCRVSYDIDVSVVLGLANVTNGKIPMVVSITLHTEPNKSSWQ